MNKLQFINPQATLQCKIKYTQVHVYNRVHPTL